MKKRAMFIVQAERANWIPFTKVPISGDWNSQFTHDVAVRQSSAYWNEKKQFPGRDHVISVCTMKHKLPRLHPVLCFFLLCLIINTGWAQSTSF